MPDDGFTVLIGALRRDMLQSVVPGQSGGTNGGTDFNDCVHPASRALVEGFFGFRPDYVGGQVTIAPQFPSTWESASFSSPQVSLNYSSDLALTTSLTVRLSQAAPQLVLRIPLCAGALEHWELSGAPEGAMVSNATEAGFGQTVLSLTISSPAPIAGPVTARVSFSSPLPAVPSVNYAGLMPGHPVTLTPPPGLALVGFSDPQGVLQPGSARVEGGQLMGILGVNVSAPSAHLVLGRAQTTAGGLPQTILFKLNISAAPSQLLAKQQATPPPPALVAAGTWSFFPLRSAANGNLLDIFKAGSYLSPRPETCAVRLGTDGWSAWTFTVWGHKPPQADFTNIPNISIAPGPVIQTPQGAQFLLGNTTGVPGGGQLNIAFASLWDIYPNVTRVEVGSGGAGAWVLIAGSTHPMQTRLANGVLRFVYAGGGGQEIELVPPFNFWALSGWGPDYDYNATAFCLPPTPPPTVVLGNSNRAMVYFAPIPQGAVLEAVELEVLSQEVVIGILAVSVMR
jgi:hypothetical protein